MEYQVSLNLAEQVFPQNLSTATAAALSAAAVPVHPMSRVMHAPKPDLRLSPDVSTGASSSAMSSAAFRQQPPPMKVCLVRNTVQEMLK